jgi:2-hydroxychromene-2-carboxylate isomerase
MTTQVDYFFDYVSPFSFLANTQLAGISERTGAEFVYRPFLLGGVMQATGNSPPVSVAAKARYMPTDIQRWCARYGVALTPNPHFPVKTIHAMRGAIAAQERGDLPVYHEALFRAVWQEGKNVGDPQVLRDVVKAAGLDADAIMSRIGEQDIKDSLRANTEDAVERGAFGAPTFFLDGEMFFGNDRLDFLEEKLRG